MDAPGAEAARDFLMLEQELPRPSPWDAARLRCAISRGGVLCVVVLLVVLLAGAGGYSFRAAQAVAPAPAEGGQPTDARLTAAIEELTRQLRSGAQPAGGRAAQGAAGRPGDTSAGNAAGGQPTDARLTAAIEELTRLLRGGAQLAGGRAATGAAGRRGDTEVGNPRAGGAGAAADVGGRSASAYAASRSGEHRKATPAVSYTRRCDRPTFYDPGTYGTRPIVCAPPPCSDLGGVDVGLECAPTSCMRFCVSMGPFHPGLGDADGQPIACGSEGASADPGSALEVVAEPKQWTPARDSFLLLHLWGAGGGGASTQRVSQADGPRGRTEAWVCGGGGGGGAYVKAIVRLRAGRTYRVEIGQGGAGGHTNPRDGRAKAGGATVLLEMVPGGPWQIIAKAAGGFGAGPYNEHFQYTPGGKGGVPAPLPAHLETNPGADGSPSRARLDIGGSRILPPDKLFSSNGADTLAGLETARKPCRYLLTPGERLPLYCYEGARVGASDYFLTCSGAFSGGSNGSSCLGSACIELGGRCALLRSDYEGVYTSFGLSKADIGPQGGDALGTMMSRAFGAGRGGSGACPVLQLPREDPTTTTTTYGYPYPYPYPPKPVWRVPHSPRGSPGLPGADGLAILHACRRRGEYTLALQRCAPAAGPWSVRGLWPEGSAYCAGAPPFDRAALSQSLQAALVASWPTCVRGGSDLGFWEQEWVAHGSCMGMSQAAYFQMTLALFQRHSPTCANTTDAECRICLTKDFELCGGLGEM